MRTPANALRSIASIRSRTLAESTATGDCRASSSCRCRRPSRTRRPTPLNGATRGSICSSGQRYSRMPFYSSIGAPPANVHSKIVSPRSATTTTMRCGSWPAHAADGASFGQLQRGLWDLARARVSPGNHCARCLDARAASIRQSTDRSDAARPREQR